jgi:hypothetical protein
MDYTTTLTEAELEKVRYAKGALPPKGHMYYPTYIPECKSGRSDQKRD